MHEVKLEVIVLAVNGVLTRGVEVELQWLEQTLRAILKFDFKKAVTKLGNDGVWVTRYLHRWVVLVAETIDLHELR
jgi:hypothetical protein